MWKGHTSRDIKRDRKIHFISPLLSHPILMSTHLISFKLCQCNMDELPRERGDSFNNLKGTQLMCFSKKNLFLGYEDEERMSV